MELPNRAARRAWLSEHHTQTESIWAVTFKKGHPKTMTYEDFVQELLCFGWIDGQAQKLDEQRTMRLCAPPQAGLGLVRRQQGAHPAAPGGGADDARRVGAD